MRHGERSGWSVIDTIPPVYYCGDCGARREPEERDGECPGRAEKPVAEPDREFVAWQGFVSFDKAGDGVGP